MNTREALVRRIVELCKERNITIDSLSNNSSVSNSTMKIIFYNGSKTPGIVIIKKLCDGLGITLGKFFSTKEFDELEQEIK